MIRKRLSTITMILAAAFFLVVSAFTLAPEDAGIETSEQISVELYFGCDTCSFGGGGTPSHCSPALFCGMTTCQNRCDMSGDLCGECACEDPTVPCEN